MDAIRLVAVTCLLAALALPCAALEYGICPPTYYPGQGVLLTESVAGDLNNLGCGWIRLPFHDEQGTISLPAFDEIISRARAHNLKVLGLVVLDPSRWNRESPEFRQAFVDRCGLLSSRYHADVDAWELWNEPEQSAVYISPASFGSMVAEAYDVIKANDPDAVVMPAGMSWPIPYLQQFYDSPAVAAYRSAHGRYPFDAVAVHPYDWSADPGYYLADWLSTVRLVLTAHGDAGKPIWITEVGWNTAANQPDSVGNDSSPSGWNDQAQALHISNLLCTARTIPDVEAVFCYALNDYALPDSLGWFGLRRYDDSPKAAWFAYRDAAHGLSAVPQVGNGGFGSGDLSDWTVFGVVNGVTGGSWFAGIVPRSGRYFLGSAVNLPGPTGGKNGGLLQRVRVRSGAVYQLSGMAWTYQEGGVDGDAAVRVGIDPFGGNDPASAAIVWSQWLHSTSGWAPVAVEATAQSSHITVLVQFRQAAPIWDVTALDDLMLRERVSAPSGMLKRLPDGALVSCDGVVVTLSGLPGPSFYVESLDRSCGIRVVSGAPVTDGDVVSLRGQMGWFGRERAVLADEVVRDGSGSVRPIGMTCRSAAGGPVVGLDGMWHAQPGCRDGAGLSSTGLLVAVCGRVTYADPAGGWFLIDDGSAAPDPLLDIKGLRVDDSMPRSFGEFVRVTGVASCIDSGDTRICRQVLATDVSVR